MTPEDKIENAALKLARDMSIAFCKWVRRDYIYTIDSYVSKEDSNKDIRECTFYTVEELYDKFFKQNQ